MRGKRRQDGMIFGPRLDLFIDGFEKPNVLRVVSFHDTPRGSVAIHAAQPQVHPGMREFLADPQITPDVVELV